MTDSLDIESAGRGKHVPERFLPHSVRGLAHARLWRKPPRGHDDVHMPIDRGDHDLNPDQPFEMFHRGPPRQAAVLVPIVAHESGATVLLTRRAEHLSYHGGQVSFPGGKIEGTDATPLAAALREAQEEIGLDPKLAEPLGYLDLYQTSSGFRIVPAVAMIPPNAELTINLNEVAVAFEVPLEFLMAPTNHKKHSRMLGELERRYYAMPFGEHYIWGATAGMLRNFYDRVYR